MVVLLLLYIYIHLTTLLHHIAAHKQQDFPCSHNSPPNCICCEEAAAPISYNKPASCEEVSCTEAFCGEALCGEASEAAMRDKTFPVKWGPFLLENPAEDIYVRTKKGKKGKSKNSKTKRFLDSAEPVPERAVQPGIEQIITRS